MDDSIEIKGELYLSTKAAAEQFGYTKDYVGQMARSGRITAKRIGRSWYVLESDLAARNKNEKTANHKGDATNNKEHHNDAVPVKQELATGSHSGSSTISEPAKTEVLTEDSVDKKPNDPSEIFGVDNYSGDTEEKSDSYATKEPEISDLGKDYGELQTKIEPIKGREPSGNAYSALNEISKRERHNKMLADMKVTYLGGERVSYEVPERKSTSATGPEAGTKTFNESPSKPSAGLNKAPDRRIRDKNPATTSNRPLSNSPKWLRVVILALLLGSLFFLLFTILFEKRTEYEGGRLETDFSVRVP